MGDWNYFPNWLAFSRNQKVLDAPFPLAGWGPLLLSLWWFSRHFLQLLHDWGSAVGSIRKDSGAQLVFPRSGTQPLYSWPLFGALFWWWFVIFAGTIKSQKWPRISKNYFASLLRSIGNNLALELRSYCHWIAWSINHLASPRHLVRPEVLCEIANRSGSPSAEIKL